MLAILVRRFAKGRKIPSNFEHPVSLRPILRQYKYMGVSPTV